MNIKLSDHFTYGRLLRFTLPSVIMMIFTSIYSVVDGLFVANLVGSNALSSVNLIFPLIMVIGAFGFMLGSGGSAEVAKVLGMGKTRQANEYFSMLIIVVAILGILLSALGMIFIRPISYLLGASEILIEDCVTYGRIMVAGSAAFMLQTTFQSFFMAAGKPQIGLVLTIAAGLTNIVLDFVFIYMFHWGVGGAAAATVCSYLVGGILPVIYFAAPNSSTLHFCKTRLYPRILLYSCTNGSSEMMTNVSQSLVTFLYNLQMMRLVGEDGVAAITVILYLSFVFMSIFIGFSMGVAPIVSYHYGAGNHDELKSIFSKSWKSIAAASLAMFLLATVTADSLAVMFVGNHQELAEMTAWGIKLSAFSFLFSGLNVFGSAFFTALCNGTISAAISFMRSLFLQAGMILLLPLVLGIDGIWLSVVIAELITMAITIAFFMGQKNRYQYL
ncbi:MAG: MATE family efflux transporter [Lachnospiraceae bacterium]